MQFKHNGVTWDLRLAHIRLIERAKACIIDEDFEDLLCLIDSDKSLAFFVDNLVPFAGSGQYEQCLFDAYVNAKHNCSNITTNALDSIFKIAKRDKLLAAGDTLPDGEEFTLYRGVAGKGGRRRVRGFSWTDSLEQACWFAANLPVLVGLENPAVYTAKVKRQEILCYTNARKEREYICRPKKSKRLDLTIADMQKLAESHRMAKHFSKFEHRK